MFTDFIFTWWQLGLLKIGLLALGIVIGAKWSKVFDKPAVYWTFLVLFLAVALYLAAVAIPQFE